jgi:hypothetical protein
VGASSVRALSMESWFLTELSQIICASLAQIAASDEIRDNLQSSEPPHKQNANQTLQIICLHFKSLLQKLDFLLSKVHKHYYYNMGTLHDVSFH